MADIKSDAVSDKKAKELLGKTVVLKLNGGLGTYFQKPAPWWLYVAQYARILTFENFCQAPAWASRRPSRSSR